MTANLTLIVENRPGALASVCDTMGRAGVNIEGLCCFESQGIAIVHMAVENAAAARTEAEKVGLKVYEERPVVVVDLEDHPGAAADTLRRLANAHVNVDLAYLATSTRMVIGTNDLAKTRAVLG